MHDYNIMSSIVCSLFSQVNPQLIKLVSEALNSGVPLIRPLWMLDPFDSYCHTVKDEFSIGEEIIVAPILKQNTHEREVN